VCVCAEVLLFKLFEPFLTLLILVRQIFVVHCQINPNNRTHLLSEIRSLKGRIVRGLEAGRLLISTNSLLFLNPIGGHPQRRATQDIIRDVVFFDTPNVFVVDVSIQVVIYIFLTSRLSG